MAPGSTVPAFLSTNGPVREVRFIHQPNGAPDGGVHDIFTIVGRPDSPAGCAISQPDFSNISNMILRIPTPVFGAGLIQSITDTTIKNNLAADPTGIKRRMGIAGHVNTSGNDGTVTRFGWKGQNKSLLIFASEAYNVEMGVTNENFPNEREEDPNCATNLWRKVRPGSTAATVRRISLGSRVSCGFSRRPRQPAGRRRCPRAPLPSTTAAACSIRSDAQRATRQL